MAKRRQRGFRDIESSSRFTPGPDAPEFFEEGTVVHEGRKFTSGGSAVTSTHAIGYPKKVNGQLVLTTWDGKRVLGRGRTVSSWPCRAPGGGHCWQGSRIYQMMFCIGGRRYTGRGFGEGMLWRGKAQKTGGKC